MQVSQAFVEAFGIYCYASTKSPAHTSLALQRHQETKEECQLELDDSERESSFTLNQNH